MLLGGGGGRSLGVLAETYTDLPNGKLSSYIASHFKTKIVSVVHTQPNPAHLVFQHIPNVFHHIIKSVYKVNTKQKESNTVHSHSFGPERHLVRGTKWVNRSRFKKAKKQALYQIDHTKNVNYLENTSKQCTVASLTNVKGGHLSKRSMSQFSEFQNLIPRSTILIN